MAVDVYIGRVVSTEDNLGGDRLKIRLYPIDSNKNVEDIPYATPLLPRVFKVRPKRGEAAIVFVSEPNTPNSMRSYLGPVISQLTDLVKSDFEGQATSLYKGSSAEPDKKIDNEGVFGEEENVAIYGRGNTDILLGEDDVRIRCGSRLMDRYSNPKAKYNKDAAYIKLKRHKNPLVTEIPDTYGTVKNETENEITLVADKINIISTNGSPNFNFEKTDEKENISDEKLKEIIEKAHRLPYGDELVDFLYAFLKMFAEHSHPSNGDSPIVGDNASKLFYEEYGLDKKKLGEKLLSKNIRIN